MKIGKTIAGRIDRVESESERLKKHQKLKKRRFFSLVFVLIILGFLAWGFIKISINLTNKKVVVKTEMEKNIPTIEIIDDNGIAISEKIKDYVGEMEKTLRELGLNPRKTVVPAGKLKEIDMYLEGRTEYYKCHMDRGIAETAEDILRMVNFVKDKDLKVQYVDVRIRGKAFYKNI